LKFSSTSAATRAMNKMAIPKIWFVFIIS
jgi:hypothetical protein